MPYEEETEYGTAHYRCIDPIENFKIKIVLQPVKNFYIPLPQFDENSSTDGSPSHGENQPEECTIKWQEKIFSRNEIEKYSSEPEWKKTLTEKYHDSIKENLNNLKHYSNKVFTYVEVDNHSISDNELDLFNRRINYTSPLTIKMNDLSITGPNLKQFKSVPKRKVINYYPTEDFKKQSHLISKNVQKMFIMVDLGSKVTDNNKLEEEDHYEAVLCSLIFNYSTSVLQMTPSFSKSKLRPYIIGVQNENGRNYYHYWIHHASPAIKSENLTKEIQLMSKVFDYQDEMKKLQINTEFFIGKPDQLYLTILGEIKSAEDFEYDNLHVHYFIKLPSGWGYSDINTLMGTTQSCSRNTYGICHFSHLFEMNFCVDVNILEDLSAPPPQIFFEVLSVDRYKRYRNEGYTYVTVPRNAGMYKYNLRCWRISDKSVKSQLERFFIGGGPELEDVSYVGLSKSEKPEVMSRFGLETISTGLIELRLNVLHQSRNFTAKKGEQTELVKSISSRLDAGSLLGSVNAILESFRKARERMLQAKKGLPSTLSGILPENQNGEKKSD